MTDDDDDVSDEGTPLPRNPELREVVAARPSDRTAMIDLEAVEAKRAAKRQAQQIEDDAVEAAADGPDGANNEVTPLPASAPERDPDATGTLARGRKNKNKNKGQTEASRVVRDEQSRTGLSRTGQSRTGQSRTGRPSRMGGDDDGTAQDEAVDEAEATAQDDAAGDGQKSVTNLRRDGTRAGTQMKRKKTSRALSPAAAAAVVVIGVVVLIVGVFFAVRATAVLTVTTVPNAAQVLLDGEPVGTSPLQKRVRTGSHVVELALEGYEPFREVVDVPSAGLPFLQPLKALPPPPPPPPTPLEIASDVAGQARRLFDGGDLDGAVAKVDEIEKLVPDHKESADLRKAIKDAVAAREAARKKDAQLAAREGQLSRSRQLAEEGKRAYDQGKLGPARTALYESLKLDGKNPDPHRTLAKIFNRENEVEKVRYHLERFLALGGNDADFKVREWLKAHPK